MQYTLTNQTIEKLKYDLVREKIITFEKLSQAENEAKIAGKSLAKIFIESNLITEHDLLKFIESKLKIPSVELKDYTIDRTCLEFINSIDAKKYKILPLFKIEDTLTVAMADPLNLFVLNHLTTEINCEIEPIICSENSINEALNLYYPTKNHSIEIDKNQHDWRRVLNTAKQDDETLEQIIFAILNQATTENVLEILLDNEINGIIINFGDGDKIFNRGNIPVLMAASFLEKLKSMAGMDSSVSKIPQLGKIKFLVNDVQIISSVATFPTIKGEKISIKLYNPPCDIEELQINSEGKKIISNSVEKAGIVFVTGQELSGKTSVVYSILNSQKNKKIITVEPIVKYELENINQCELNEKVGFDIAKALKFIEFQDFDIVYFASAPTRAALEYLNILAVGGKTIITEILTDNYKDFVEKFDFSPVKNTLNCIVNIENDTISVIDKKGAKV